MSLKLLPEEARHIVELGLWITKAANDQLGFQHPLQPDWKHILFCQITGALHQDGENLSGLNAVVIQPGKLIVPHVVQAYVPVWWFCIQISDKLISRSVINSQFKGETVKPTKVGENDAIIPAISGKGWIIGTHQHTLDPTDPWPEGCRISNA